MRTAFESLNASCAGSLRSISTAAAESVINLALFYVRVMARVPRPFACFTALVIALSAASCMLPKGGHVNEGPGSLESIRQKLAGDWDLVSLTTDVESGKAVSWDVGGHLQYDQYG